MAVPASRPSCCRDEAEPETQASAADPAAAAAPSHQGAPHVHAAAVAGEPSAAAGCGTDASSLVWYHLHSTSSQQKPKIKPRPTRRAKLLVVPSSMLRYH